MEIIHALVDAGARLDIVDAQGHTPGEVAGGNTRLLLDGLARQG